MKDAGQIADQLRDLIREAHAATRDLVPLLREYRQARAAGITAAREAAADAANEELKRFSQHLQKEMNQHAANLNASVIRAQENVIRSLTLARVERDGERGLKFIFDGSQFDDNVPTDEDSTTTRTRRRRPPR